METKNIQLARFRSNCRDIFSSVKKAGRVIESDHCPISIDVNLKFSDRKPERVEIFDFKNNESQLEFKKLTTNTTVFSDCFKNELPFEAQAFKWRRVLTEFFHKSFKKIRISNKPKRKSKIVEFMERRQKLKKKSVLSVISEKEEEEIRNLELMIAEACEEENRKKIIDNFKDMDGNNGNLNHQGVRVSGAHDVNQQATYNI